MNKQRNYCLITEQNNGLTTFFMIYHKYFKFELTKHSAVTSITALFSTIATTFTLQYFHIS